QKVLSFFFDKIVPRQLMVDDSSVSLTCWQIVLQKLVQSHDPLIRKIIADPQPLLMLKNEENEQVFTQMIKTLCQECFYWLKKTPPGEGSDSFFFSFLSQHVREREDIVLFIRFYLSTPSVEEFSAASKLLNKEVLNIDWDTLVSIFSVIERR